MKLLKIAFGLSLLTLTAFGRGYVQLIPAYHWPTGQVEPKAAFGFYEPLIAGLHYDGWFGAGAYPANGTLWAATTQRVHIPLTEKLTVAPGVVLRTSASQVPNLEPFLGNSEVHVSLTYELW